jgi:UDP:flavonoid glycosyltransferase YjiC (YdhE family)
MGIADYGHPMFEGQFSPWLNLAFFSPYFAVSQPDWPTQTVATGFPFPDLLNTNLSDLPTPVRDFLASGEPPIIFTLGSSAVHIADDFYNTAARAIKNLAGKQRALFLIGNNQLNESLTDDMLCWDYLPYGQLFTHASLIVHQGGIGTTAQAMRAGKPMLIVPYGFDQPDNAARAHRLGISLTLSKKHYTKKILLQALEKLLGNEKYRHNANELGAKIRIENAFDVACKRIEALL